MDDEHDDGDDKYCDESVRTVIMIIVTMIWMLNMNANSNIDDDNGCDEDADNNELDDSPLHTVVLFYGT